jgi:hypothetical protein
MKIGQTVRDRITGFCGTVIGAVEYITGCRQFQLQPKAKAEGDFVEARWLDEDRLEILNAEPVSLAPAPNTEEIK